MIRYYICPVDSVQVIPLHFQRQSRIEVIARANALQINTNMAHTADYAWCLVFADAADFTLIDADPECVEVWDKLGDALAAHSKTQIVTWLKNNTIGSINATRRNKIQNYLTGKGVDLTGLTLTSTLFEVAQRLMQRLNSNSFEGLGY